MTGRPVVAILLGAYWPGSESSGPNLSIRAMCETLADDFDFRLIARDRPFGAAQHSPEVRDGWQDAGFARARYLNVGRLGARGLTATLHETGHDLLMLNGFFDREFTIPALVARRVGRLPRAGTILSPRGEFSAGALSIGAGQKRLYRSVADAVGLLNGVHLHATSEAEEDDLRAGLPQLPLQRITNFRPLPAQVPSVPRTAGQPLRAAFLGRISPVKGLEFALDVLKQVRVSVDYDIYGPISDAAYWDRCQAQISALPPHVRAVHRGELPNDQVARVMAQTDLMFLPSHSENFGHAIFEALAAGTPVLIGDATPWRGLAVRRAGEDLSLAQPAAFVAAIERFAAMPPEHAAEWRAGARGCAEAHATASTAAREMRAFMYSVIAEKRR